LRTELGTRRAPCRGCSLLEDMGVLLGQVLRSEGGRSGGKGRKGEKGEKGSSFEISDIVRRMDQRGAWKVRTRGADTGPGHTSAMAPGTGNCLIGQSDRLCYAFCSAAKVLTNNLPRCNR
jgi:hypothetical protein